MRTVIVLLIGSLAFSCNSNKDGDSKDGGEPSRQKWSVVPEEVPIDSLKKTAFVPTLESNIEPGKNIVYTAAFPYAWEEFRKTGNMITIPHGAPEDLTKLNNSRSYTDALDKNEFSASGELVNGAIEVRSSFNKALPFHSQLQTMGYIIFEMDTVRSFGATSYSKAIDDLIDILYFKSDSQFVLSLNPADSAHQIIIAMGVPKVKTLEEAINKIRTSVRNGEKEKSQPEKAWRYQFVEGDLIAIPSFSFNLSKHYSTMEGQYLQVGSVERRIAIAYQRTALVLNEYGAIVEGESTIATTSADTLAVIPKPKNMVCNRPFYVVIQHKGRQNPYFVMKVENGELMVKAR
jgi:hypothetical protein